MTNFLEVTELECDEVAGKVLARRLGRKANIGRWGTQSRRATRIKAKLR